MPSNIYIFETRPVNYLKPYVDKARSLGYNVVLTDNATLLPDQRFKDFVKVYKHYSVNSPEFEIACFARYFAIASLAQDNEGFLMTDTDVYVTRSFRDLQTNNYHNVFIGSEGFDHRGTQEQISPHCTFWNKALLMDFIDFTIQLYRQDAETNFLEQYYADLTRKYGRTAISDMNLIYLWVQANKIPYLNSNASTFEFGIDHNISALRCSDDEFVAFAGRKSLKFEGSDKISCTLASGNKQNMALLHFQGAYKNILQPFYSKRYTKFLYFTIKNNYRNSKRLFSS